MIHYNAVHVINLVERIIKWTMEKLLPWSQILDFYLSSMTQGFLPGILAISYGAPAAYGCTNIQDSCTCPVQVVWASISIIVWYHWPWPWPSPAIPSAWDLHHLTPCTAEPFCLQPSMPIGWQDFTFFHDSFHRITLCTLSELSTSVFRVELN